MHKFLYLALSIFSLGMFVACTSLEDDAKKAAELNRRSMGYAKENRMKDADETYKESQEIVAKYKDSDRFEEFYTIYSEQMQLGE